MRPVESGSAHGAWFYGYVKGGIMKELCTKGVGRCGYGEHFRVGSRVMEGLNEVVRPSNDSAPRYDDRPYGYLLLIEGLLGFLESKVHETYIILEASKHGS